MSLLLIFQSDAAPPPYPDVGHRQVSARLLDYDGVEVPGDLLESAFGISFYDELNGPGRGQVSLPISEPGAAFLQPGRYVDCQVEDASGTPQSRFTFKIEGNPAYKVIQRGEEYEQVVSVSGRGWACVMDEAIIYPEYERDFVISTTWRLFSFASPRYPKSTGPWPDAHAYAEYLEGVSTLYCYGHFQNAPDGLAYPAPIGFPWTTNPFNLVAGVPTANYVDTYWLRPNASVLPDWLDTGYYFFRREFTLTDDITPVTFTVTGDNFFTLFLEGVPILGEPIDNADHWMWQGWKEHQMFLPAGTYTVAAAIYNISFDDLGATTPPARGPCTDEGYAGGNTYGNVGGLLFAAYVAGDAVTAPTHILSSDDRWESWYDAEFWPGWTPGEIISALVNEALFRGAMDIYTGGSFTDTTDSLGLVWRPVVIDIDRPDIPTVAFEVGSTVMAALEQLDEMGWINWHVRPGTLSLDVWRGREPSPPASSATLAHGVNLRALERSATAPYANALMVQWEGGYAVLAADGSPEAIAAGLTVDEITAYGTRVEDVFASDAASEEEAVLQGYNELLRRAQSQYPAVVVVVEPTSTTDCPYEGYGINDYVTIPAEGGGTEISKVYSIQCDQDDEGWAIWTSELNAKLDVPERSTLELLRQIGGRNQVVRGAVH